MTHFTRMLAGSPSVTSPTGTHLSSVVGCTYKPNAPFSQNKILSHTQGERHQPLSPPLVEVEEVYPNILARDLAQSVLFQSD